MGGEVINENDDVIEFVMRICSLVKVSDVVISLQEPLSFSPLFPIYFFLFVDLSQILFR